MKKYRLGIDVDGLLANFVLGFNKLAQQMFNVTLEYPATTWHWWENTGNLTKDQLASLNTHIEANSWWWGYLPPFESTRESIQTANYWRLDHDVYYITARYGQYAKRATELFLEQHGAQSPTVLIVEKPEEKVVLAEGLHLTHFVDDKIETVVAMQGYHRDCISRLWHTRQNESAKHLTRIHSLEELMAFEEEVRDAA